MLDEESPDESTVLLIVYSPPLRWAPQNECIWTVRGFHSLPPLVSREEGCWWVGAFVRWRRLRPSGTSFRHLQSTNKRNSYFLTSLPASCRSQQRISAWRDILHWCTGDPWRDRGESLFSPCPPAHTLGSSNPLRDGDSPSSPGRTPHNLAESLLRFTRWVLQKARSVLGKDEDISSHCPQHRWGVDERQGETVPRVWVVCCNECAVLMFVGYSELWVSDAWRVIGIAFIC